jgi:hypothetical protein
MPVEVNKKIRAPNPGGTLCKNDARHFQEILTVYGTRSHSLMLESVLSGLPRWRSTHFSSEDPAPGGFFQRHVGDNRFILVVAIKALSIYGYSIRYKLD